MLNQLQACSNNTNTTAQHRDTLLQRLTSNERARSGRAQQKDRESAACAARRTDDSSCEEGLEAAEETPTTTKAEENGQLSADEDAAQNSPSQEPEAQLGVNEGTIGSFQWEL